MRVLYFASEYFPYNNTGTFRTARFVKSLDTAGIEVKLVTLTREASDKLIGKSKIDSSLVDIESVEIFRIIPEDLISHFFTFKSYLSNIGIKKFKPFFDLINSILTSFRPDVIIATHPHSATIRLAELISTKYSIPFIVDMRDTWSYWPMAAYRSRIHHYLVKRAEKKIFSKSVGIFTVTPEVKEIFIDSHGEILRKKIKVIYNGYEGSSSFPDRIVVDNSSQQTPITIGYVGSFYFDPILRNRRFNKWYKRKGIDRLSYFSGNEDWLYRSPYFFLKILKEAFEKYPHLKSKIFVEFIGKQEEWLNEMIQEFDLSNNCRQIGFLHKDQLKEKYENLDCLLATSEKVINGRSYCLPSKLFDYIKIGKPIIGVMTEGIQKDFLNNSRMAIILDPENVDESVIALKEFFTTRNEFMPNKTFLESFSTQVSSLEFIKELKKALQN